MNMFQKRIVFLLVIILFSHFSIAQTQKELNKMNYDELLSDFSTNENDVTRQKVSAEYYIKKQKKKTIRVN